MLAATLIKCLRKHGQRMDAEIAEETGVPLDLVRALLNGVSERGAIASCSVTRYNKGEPVEGFLYRIAGYRPPATPGRKSAPRKPN
jgi:transcription initiation factor IIE alpha subunit